MPGFESTTLSDHSRADYNLNPMIYNNFPFIFQLKPIRYDSVYSYEEISFNMPPIRSLSSRGGARVFAWGGGGGGQNASQLPPPASKVAQVLKKLMSGAGAGTPTHFFSDVKNFSKNYHNGVGVLSSWT